MASSDMGYSDMSSPSQAQDDEKEPMDGEGEEEHEQQFVVQKSVFKDQDPKPGEEYYFKVDEVHDDSVIMSYATGKDESKDEGSTMDKAKAGIDKYASEPSGDM